MIINFELRKKGSKAVFIKNLKGKIFNRHENKLLAYLNTLMSLVFQKPRKLRS